MARSSSIPDPTKVTLYVSKSVLDRIKDFASDQKKSLSGLSTELWERELSGTVRHQLEVPPEIQHFLVNQARLMKTDVPSAALAVLHKVSTTYDPENSGD